jgi:hypothetical protein
VRGSDSSIGQEVLWLLAWLIIFVVLNWLLVKFLVPHHFNVFIAVVLSAIISSLAWIGLRAYAARRA